MIGFFFDWLFELTIQTFVTISIRLGFQIFQFLTTNFKGWTFVSINIGIITIGAFLATGKAQCKEGK